MNFTTLYSIFALILFSNTPLLQSMVHQQRALKFNMEEMFNGVNKTTNEKINKISYHDKVAGAFVLENALCENECKALMKVIEELHSLHLKDILENTARRKSQVHIPVMVDQKCLKGLCERLRAFLPLIVAGYNLEEPGLEISNFVRTYMYQNGDFSSPHYDKSYRKVVDGKCTQFSGYSMVFYLNDGFENGQTTFFEHDPSLAVSNKGNTPIIRDRSQLKACCQVGPRAGDVLCFPHGHVPGSLPSPLHEGSKVENGCKYILRTDIVYQHTTKRKTVHHQPKMISIDPNIALEMESIFRDAIAVEHKDWLPFVDRSVSMSRISYGYQMECKLAEKLFWHFYRMQKKKQNQMVSITSSYGVVREYSRRGLADYIMQLLPLNSSIGYVSLVHSSKKDVSSGVIVMSTKQFIQQRLAQGLLMCELCGKFVLQSTNGLEWHLKTLHQVNSHATAHDAVVRSSSALIKIIQNSSQPSISADVRLHPNDMQQAMHNPTLLSNLVSTKKIKSLGAPLNACREGDLSTLKSYVASGWNPITSLDKNGCSGLLWAAGFGHLSICQYLIEECHMNPILEIQQGRRGYNERSALHWAARNGQLPIVQYLIESQSVPVDIQSSDGTTPLCLAAWQGHFQLCKYLITSANANAHLVNSYGCNLAMWCAQSSSKSPTLLRLCKYLFDEIKVNFSLLNHNGQGCLHKAAQRGNYHLCEWLINHVQLSKVHFQPNASESSTPSQLAHFSGHFKLCQYLTQFES